jgi:hypothetical protein
MFLSQTFGAVQPAVGSAALHSTEHVLLFHFLLLGILAGMASLHSTWHVVSFQCLTDIIELGIALHTNPHSEKLQRLSSGSGLFLGGFVNGQ